MALVPYYARDLPQESQALIIDRPDSWEARLFSDVLSFEVSLHSSLRRDYRSEVPWGPSVSFRNRQEVFGWLQAHLSEAEGFGARATVLLNKLGEMHRRAIEWVLALRRSVRDPLFARLTHLIERLVEDIIRQIEEYAEKLAASIGQALIVQHRTPTTIALTLTLTVPEDVPEQLHQEFERLRTYFEANPFELL